MLGFSSTEKNFYRAWTPAEGSMYRARMKQRESLIMGDFLVYVVHVVFSRGISHKADRGHGHHCTTCNALTNFMYIFGQKTGKGLQFLKQSRHETRLSAADQMSVLDPWTLG